MMTSIEIYKKFLEKKQQNEQKIGNVVGGPLDGAYIPKGTRYQWDNRMKRWIFINSL